MVDSVNPPLKNPAKGKGDPKIKERVRAKHRIVAEMLARGFPPKLIAEKTRLSPNRIYHLANDAFVISEIERIQEQMFQTQDAVLLELYRKALQEVEEFLINGKSKERMVAVNLIIRIFLARTSNMGFPLIQELCGR